MNPSESSAGRRDATKCFRIRTEIPTSQKYLNFTESLHILRSRRRIAGDKHLLRSEVIIKVHKEQTTFCHR